MENTDHFSYFVFIFPVLVIALTIYCFILQKKFLEHRKKRVCIVGGTVTIQCILLVVVVLFFMK